MTCCDYGCTRAANCPAGSVVAGKLLDGTDFRLMDYEQKQSFNAACERANRQWLARNEGESNQQLHGFKPPFVKHEEIEELLTPAKVLVGCGVFLAVCVTLAVAALNYWR